MRFPVLPNVPPEAPPSEPLPLPLTHPVRILRLLVAATGLVFLLGYVALALVRLRYPFELEWMEGGTVGHVRRVLQGLPIYAKPSLEFVSFPYAPFYYWMGAAVSWILGPGLYPLRLLSWMASLGAFALIFLLVRRETGSRMAGLLSACLFAATFRKSGGWFDLARVDSLFMLLVLAAVYLARSGASRRSQVSAGLLAAAAILTKQNALVVLAPLLLLLLVSQARRSLLFVGTATVATAAVVLYLNLTTSGWFLYYCLVLLSHHPHVPGAFWRFWSHDLLPLLPLVVLSFAFLITEWRGWFAWNRHFALALLVGMLGSSWLVRAGVGAEANNLMPAFAGLAIGAGLALAAIPARWGGRSPLRQLQIEGAALCSLLLQFGLLVYRPGSQLPTRADRAAGESVVARLRAVPGEVFLPHHGYLARMAGKHEYAHTVAMDDVFLADRGPARDDLFAQLIAALNERRFAAVVLESDRRYARFVLPSYDIAEDLYSSDQVFYPVTGARLRPEYLCLPKRPGSAAPR